MLEPLSKTIQGVVNFTWPMIIISVVVLVSLRVSYLIKYRKEKKFFLYKELLMLSFVIYIMCLFQVVTFQDTAYWASNNFVPFKEIMRYNIGSRLFFKNVLGNMIMFLPYGFFASYLLHNKKLSLSLVLTIIASVSIEVVQLVIGRVFDVDDIILNVLGGSLGFLIYYVVDTLWDKLPEILRKNFVLDIISIIILVLFIVILV